ncbi:MAG: hypothetical protein AB7E72_06060 [Lysobacterales bacterium]
MNFLLPSQELDYVKMRINGVGEAANSARWIFASTTITCMVQLVVLWNFNLSWLRVMVAQDQIRLKSRGANPLLAETLATQWVESIYFNIPIISVKASVTDLGIIGGVALLILVTWKLYALKRENYLIEDLLTEVSTKLTTCKSYVYFGIMGHQLFVNVNPGGESRKYGNAKGEPLREQDAEAAILSRKRDRQLDRGRIRLRRILLSSLTRRSWGDLARALGNLVPRRIPKMPNDASGKAFVLVMFMLPSLTVYAAFVSDICSLYTYSVFRHTREDLIAMLPFESYYWRLVVNGVLAIVVTRLTLSAYGYQSGTVQMMQDAYDSGWDILRER